MVKVRAAIESDVPLILELIRALAEYEKLAQLIIGDIRSISPETDIRPTVIEFNDPWDLEEVYGELLDFAKEIASAAD